MTDLQSDSAATFPGMCWQNRPAQHRRAVFLCADHRYFPYSLFLANQIALSHKGRDFDICIVSDKPFLEHPLVGSLDIRLVQLDMQGIGDHANIGQRLGLTAYLRVFMPRIWADDYEKLLYLDGDIFYQRGNISDLLKCDLQFAPLSAVLDTKQWHKPNRHASDISALGLPFAPYFNSGVLLIDVVQYSALDIDRKVMQLILSRGKELIWHDQTALNAVVGGDWAELPLIWNFQCSHKTMLLDKKFDVCFYHFIGRRKPFYHRYGGFPRRFVDPYRAFLSQHFPTLADRVQADVAAPLRWAVMALIVIFNLTMARGAARMRARAQGDFDIHPATRDL